MKKFIPKNTKWLASLTLLSAAMLAVGIVLICVGTSNVGVQIGFTMLGGLLGILFFSCYLAEKSRTLVIDGDKMIFPRGADKNGKMVFQKTAVKLDEICAVESRLRRGDKLLTEDTYFHALTLKDGTRITVTLYEYGKDSEKEILEMIKNSIS